MPQYSISAIGRDRPGIVAAISAALYENGGNLEDSRMAILSGHFAMMLTIELEEGARVDLEARLERVREELELDAVSLNPIAEAGGGDGEPTHVLTVYGADHPGIVHSICSALAEDGANVTDLKTQLAGSADSPIYVMFVELALGRSSAEDLAAVLTERGSEARVEVSLRELEIEAL